MAAGRIVVVGLTGGIGMGKSTLASHFRRLGVRVWDADSAVHRIYAPSGAAVVPLQQEFGDAVIGAAGGIDRGALSTLIKGSADKGASIFAALERIVHPLVQSERRDFVAAAEKEGEWLCVVDVPLLLEGVKDDLVVQGGEGGVPGGGAALAAAKAESGCGSEGKAVGGGSGSGSGSGSDGGGSTGVEAGTDVSDARRSAIREKLGVDAVVLVSCPEALQRDRCLARAGMTAEKLAAIRARQLPDAVKRRYADYVV